MASSEFIIYVVDTNKKASLSFEALEVGWLLFSGCGSCKGHESNSRIFHLHLDSALLQPSLYVILTRSLGERAEAYTAVPLLRCGRGSTFP